MSKRRTVRNDTSKLMDRVNARLGADQKDVPASHGEHEMPADFPMKLLFNRVYGDMKGRDGPAINALLGWTLDMFAITVDNVHIRVKVSRDPRAVVVMVDDEEVYRYVINRDGDPEVHPGKLWKEMQAERDGKFVDLVDLQPGDFVEEDELGNPIIIRDEELPGMWEQADFTGGRDEVRGPDWTPPSHGYENDGNTFAPDLDEVLDDYIEEDDDDLIIDDDDGDDIEWE